MNQRHYLLRGTFILTFTGLLTRAAGFLYKIFLSRTIGAEQIGLFQLTLPVFAFCMALGSGGIQTAVSRYTAEYFAEKEDRAALRILASALLLSSGLSVCCAAALFLGASRVARSFLLEPSCALLLRMTALSLPFAAVHGCISGFFIGCKNITVSAVSQFMEQLVRIVSVLFFFTVFSGRGRTPDASVMALGQIAGEAAAALYCLCHLVFGKKAPLRTLRASRNHSGRPGRLLPGRVDFEKTLSVSMPLGVNRMLMCVLQGIEAALLPQMLRRFGYSGQDALAVYGTMTGMALPLILFPTAVTGALGTLLLPAVSEARALNQGKKITGTVDASFQGSLLLGFFFLSVFLLFGGTIGQLLFHNALAGEFTRKLALICPFLYINTTMSSILHGLGFTVPVSLWNIAGFGVRLAAVILFVPRAGIDGYFVGMLLSQALITVCTLVLLRRSSGFRADLAKSVIRPGAVCIASGVALLAFRAVFPALLAQSWGALLLSSAAYTAVFLSLGFFLLLEESGRRLLPGRR